jgi:hypothetical protein
VTRKQASRLEPVASFVVEREVGRGYRVTASNGDCPEERKTRALKFLDDLGQPDPRGPKEFFRWLGPIAHSGEYIVVSIKLMPNGEARYHQGWFRLLPPADRGRFPAWAFSLVLVAGLVSGFLAGRTLFALDRPTRLDSAGMPAANGPVPSGLEPGLRSPEPTSDPGLAKLNKQLRTSRELRLKVKKYLSQDGLAATSAEVSDVKRSVKLIADLDKTPPRIESIQLDNAEVAKLLGVLQALDDIQERATSTPVGAGRS